MNSYISWIGGKKLLRKKILEQFPTDYKRYVEVFGGAGWVLFAEERKGKEEIFNDANSELINLHRCVKYHPNELQRELEFLRLSREVFLDAKEQIQVRGLTDIQRAARFFILIKESYGSKMSTFGVKIRDVQANIEYITEVSKRLNKVVIENLDFEKLILNYDKEETFFYLDPPYFGTEKYYSVGFSKEDHKRLRELLGNIKGKFLLSYNDCKEIEEMYTGYEIIRTERFNNLTTTTGGKKYKEFLIKNY